MASQKSMPVTIAATELRRHFGDFLRRAFSGEEHFIVEREGFPVAAIISMKEYEEFIKDREQKDQERAEKSRQFYDLVRPFGEEIARQGISEEELDARVEAARQKLYEETYGRKPVK